MSAATPSPWLSVLVPVYNVQDYLEECLASVIGQLQALPDDGAGVEVLVLDDQSTDGSRALMDGLSERWPGRLRLLQHARNGGLSAARNTMIDAARGEYLWFLDSDDKLLPGALAGLLAQVQQHRPDAVLCDFSVWRERPRLKHRLRGEGHRRTSTSPAGGLYRDRAALLAGVLATGQLHAWSKITRRALWGTDLRFPPGAYFEDMATMPLALLRAHSHCYVAAPWVAYRQRGGSILSTMTLPKAQDQVQALGVFAQALARAQASGELPADAALRFAFAHHCARSLQGALRFAERAPLPAAELRDVQARWRREFTAISPLTGPQLLWAYVRRGWWWRALRLRRALGQDAA